MAKYDTEGCGCLGLLGILFFPFVVLSELCKKIK
jgi:hypothetical protein